MSTLRFIDLFAGIGGFHYALAGLGHECVFACELDPDLRELYRCNFPSMTGQIHADIRACHDLVPEHDILCAGFPCQPFSKSGEQLGTRDETRGTLFHEILTILERWRPQFVMLENVGNFGRHDRGNTWRIIRERLTSMNYEVHGTEHVTPPPTHDWRDAGLSATRRIRSSNRAPRPDWRGTGLISPHHLGHPHHRERFYIVASQTPLATSPFPIVDRKTITDLRTIVQPSRELNSRDRQETRLSQQQLACIDHWNWLLAAIPSSIAIPSFPIWGDELDANYPFEDRTPWATPTISLRRLIGAGLASGASHTDLLHRLPKYAREPLHSFRAWKIRYIRENRTWWKSIRRYIPAGWAKTLHTFPPSLRKLEWNAKGGARNLWEHVLQFRPSGLRVKRYTSSPALVAMTSTQIPILGPKRRFLTRTEGLRLQGFPAEHRLPETRDSAFRALGNAVHVAVVQEIAARMLAAAASASPGSKESPPIERQRHG